MTKVCKKPCSVKRSKYRHRRKKAVYRLKNWSAYNEGLKARGSLTIWFSAEALAAWAYQGPPQRGGQFVYSELAIQTCLTLRLLYHLALRQTEGFVASILALLGLRLSVPDSSTLCRRQGSLAVDLSARSGADALHVAIDSSGLKVYGEGEWLVRQHGWAKHRRWIKLHLCVDTASGQILATCVTTNQASDAGQVDALLTAVTSRIDTLSADGQYDQWAVYTTLARPPHQTAPIRPAIAPRKNAKIKQPGNAHAPALPRDAAIRRIRQQGRAAWKRTSGYHRRSLAETAMGRYKSIIDDHARSRSFTNQNTEVRLGCKILNEMDRLAKPVSYKVDVGS